MENSQLIAASLSGDPKDKAPVKIDNNVRQAWNAYIDFLDKKGLKGSPMLDHNNMGFKMIDEYNTENPDLPLDKTLIVPIQQEFSRYRQNALQQIEQGKAKFAPGTNKDNFLKALSVVDGIPGQRSTSFKFPTSTMVDNTKGTVVNKGYLENTVDDSPTVRALNSQKIVRGFQQ